MSLAELQQHTRQQVLGLVQAADDVTFFRTPGNLGDQLIQAGAKSLLADLGVGYRHRHINEALQTTGDVALVSGSGGWCRPFHAMPALVAPLEANFRRVVILPSSFDLQEPTVTAWLAQTPAVVMAREAVSRAIVARYRRAHLGLDSAFFFDFRPFQRPGEGALSAFRTDAESARLAALGQDNNDISLTCDSLDEWLETISRYAVVRTDRAHVMVAAAMMGKTVQVWASNYHKVRAIAEYAGLAVELMPGIPMQ